MGLLYLLAIAALPFGPAVQNIASALVLGFLLFDTIRSFSGLKKSIFQSTSSKRFSFAALFFLLFYLWLGLSAVLYSGNFTQGFLKNLAGFLPVALTPLLFANFLKKNPSPLKFDLKSHSQQLWIFVFLGLALLTLSQLLYPWILVGSSFENAPFRRAQGFYSHPLTLAYAAAVFFPYFLQYFLSSSGLSTILGLLSAIVVVMGSQSRSVIGLSAGLMILASLRLTSLRYKILGSFLVLIFLAGSLGLFRVSNMGADSDATSAVRKSDQTSEKYQDDRLAFWHAHWVLWQQRPFLGYGYSIDAKTRSLGYEAIGLTHFAKKYNAHNQWLELLVKGGLIGALLFSLSLTYLLLGLRAQNHPWARNAILTLGFMLLAGLTQNWFEDSEVRYALTLYLCQIALLLAKPRDLLFSANEVNGVRSSALIYETSSKSGK